MTRIEANIEATEQGHPRLDLLSANAAMGAALAERATRAGISARAVTVAKDATAPVLAIVATAAAEVLGLAALAAVRRAADGHMVVLPAVPGADLAVWQAVLEPAGAVVADGMQAFCDIAGHLAASAGKPMPAGLGVAIVSGGGGNGVMCADLCAHAGLKVPPLEPRTRAALGPLMPPIASSANPVDITPQMHAPKFAPNFPEVLDLIARDPGISILLFPVNALTGSNGDRTAAVIDLARRSAATVVMAANLLDPGEGAAMGREGLYNFEEPVRAVAALAALVRADAAYRTASAEPVEANGAVLEAAGVEAALQAAGVSLEARRPAEDGAAGLSPPLAMHLPGAGGAVQRMTAAELPAAPAPGTILREAPGGVQISVGLWQEPELGPMIRVASGGLTRVLMRDAVTARAPLDAAAAARMIATVGVIRAIGKIDCDVSAEAVAGHVAALSRLAPQLPEGARLELDPVRIDAAGAAHVGDWRLD